MGSPPLAAPCSCPQDCADSTWADTAERPYDPPLTAKGEEAALQVGRDLRNAGIDFVVSSPFLRCLQTAMKVCEGLEMKKGIWEGEGGRGGGSGWQRYWAPLTKKR